MIRYLIISSFLNFFAAGVLAFAVVVRGRKDRINVSFGLFAFMIGAWSAGYCLWQISVEETRALFFARLLMFFAYFLPVVFLNFVAELCGENRRRWVRVGYVCCAAFAILNFTPLMVAQVGRIGGFPFWPKAGELYWLYIVFFAIYTGKAGWLLVNNLRKATGSRAIQLRSIMIASAIGFSGGATNFPLWYGIPVQPLGNPLVFLYLLIMAHAVSRYQLPLVTYDFVHAAVYIGFSVTLAVFYIFGLASLAPLLGYELSVQSMQTQFLLCVVVTLFFVWAVPRLSRATERILAQTFLRRRNTQQQQLKELGHRITALGSEDEIFQNSVREIAKAFALPNAAIYVRGEFDQEYRLRAVSSREPCMPVIPADSRLVKILQQRQLPILIDGSEMEQEQAIVVDLQKGGALFPLAAAFPISSDDFLSGVLLLGARPEDERYTEGELTLLESTCLQIAVTMRARQLERRASQTEKLIALGTLASGLAHELRNPLVSIQTFSSLLKERGADLDFQQEFSAVVQRDVNRIASIVENVAAFAESNRVQMTPVNLGEVITASSEIVRPELQKHGVELVLPLNEGLCVQANYSQLLQVFLNLMQNAVQAMEGRTGSRLSVHYDLRYDAKQPLICVTLADNGPGIDPAMLPHIFEPFTTTKATGSRFGKHGMGLGLAIVKRIIQHHHGEINVTSVLGQGTTFRVFLPPSSLSHA